MHGRKCLNDDSVGSPGGITPLTPLTAGSNLTIIRGTRSIFLPGTKPAPPTHSGTVQLDDGFHSRKNDEKKIISIESNNVLNTSAKQRGNAIYNKMQNDKHTIFDAEYWTLLLQNRALLCLVYTCKILSYSANPVHIPSPICSGQSQGCRTGLSSASCINAEHCLILPAYRESSDRKFGMSRTLSCSATLYTNSSLQIVF